jgi:hypothetical protein
LIGYGQSITDARGNVWTITAGGQVAVNGVADPTTKNVTHLAYANGLVWQENTSNLWWSKTAPSAAWSPPYGTSAVPVPVSASPDESVLGAPIPGSPSAITDGSGNHWTIVNGKVVVNGVADPTTANVIELAYVGGRLWQENSQGLWWYKTTPASGWSGGYGIASNPIGSPYYVANNPGDQATIYVGKVTVNEQPTVFNAVTEVVTTGFDANGTAIGISAQGAKIIVIDGASSLTNGATLTLLSAFRAPGPNYAATENNGAMTLTDSTAHIGALSGTGSITASGNSSIDVQTATSGETIQLLASHLTIGGQQGFGAGTGPAGGMSFLAPISMDNSAASSITLANTQATSMILKEPGGSLQEVLLYNGSAEVADLKISGPSILYAEQQVTGSTPYIELLTQPVAHPLPTTIQS